MAIYHLHIQIITRGKGKSAVAAAAYRSGEKLTNNYDGQIHDFTRKGGVVHTEILLPDHAPKEFADRSTLWNSVEKIEKSVNSQLAREIEIALPKELSAEQNISLVSEYVRQNFVSAGMCADVCIHDKNDGSKFLPLRAKTALESSVEASEDSKTRGRALHAVSNPHAHIMLTMRPIEPDGRWGTKQRKEYILDENGEKIYDKNKRQYKCNTVPTTDWNEQTKAEEWRAGWTDIINQFLESENIAERVDHRSFERQGVELKPTIHMGVAATQMERKGIATERGEINRKVKSVNKELQQIKARLNTLNKWLETESHNDSVNSQDVISKILGGEYKTQQQKVSALKVAAAIDNLSNGNGANLVSQLQEKIKELYKKQSELSDKMKPIERRQKTLVEHIKQAEYYQQFKDIYSQYQQQKPKNKEAFRNSHSREIILYEAAKKYLDEHLNGHALSLKTWKSEAVNLQSEKDMLYRRFTALKDEVCEVEIIKRNVEKIIRDGELVQKNSRNKGMEL